VPPGRGPHYSLDTDVPTAAILSGCGIDRAACIRGWLSSLAWAPSSSHRRSGSTPERDTASPARRVWLAHYSVLGHKIKSLTSGFPADRRVPEAYALVTGVGVQVPLGHTRPGARVRRGCFSEVRSRMSWSIATPGRGSPNVYRSPARRMTLIGGSTSAIGSTRPRSRPGSAAGAVRSLDGAPSPRSRRSTPQPLVASRDSEYWRRPSIRSSGEPAVGSLPVPDPWMSRGQASP
jgi:hypothetical protein